MGPFIFLSTYKKRKGSNNHAKWDPPARGMPPCDDSMLNVRVIGVTYVKYKLNVCNDC